MVLYENTCVCGANSAMQQLHTHILYVQINKCVVNGKCARAHINQTF